MRFEETGCGLLLPEKTESEKPKSLRNDDGSFLMSKDLADKFFYLLHCRGHIESRSISGFIYAQHLEEMCDVIRDETGFEIPEFT